LVVFLLDYGERSKLRSYPYGREIANMPDKVIKDIVDRLSKARDNGQEHHGELIFKIADNKIVSYELRLDIKEDKKGCLT